MARRSATFTSVESKLHLAARSNTGISRSTNATLVFNLVLSGASIAEQDGRVTPLRVGSGAPCDADRPDRLHPDGAFEIHQINCWKTRVRRSPATCGAGVSSVALNN